MIDSKYAGIVMSLMISLGMSFVMSCVMTVANLGLVQGFFFVWMKSWATAFPIAFIAALLIVPVSRKITERLTRAAPGDSRNNQGL